MLKTITIDPERRAEIAKLIGRAFLIVVPVIGIIAFVAFVVWSFRRQAVLPEGQIVGTTEEPPYEVPSAAIPV